MQLLLSNQLITNFKNQINMSKASLKSNYINEDSNGIKKNTAFNILGYLDNNLSNISKKRIRIYKDSNYHIIHNEKELTIENQPEYNAELYLISHFDL